MFLASIVVFIVSIINFFYLKPPVVNWDEGTHALWGFKEWLALRSGNLHSFWQLSRNQFSYPPLGSWLIAFTNLPAEFSINLARFNSTLGFIAGGILLVLIARVLPTTSLVEDLPRRQSPSAAGPTPRKLTNFSVCHPRLYRLLNTKYFPLLLFLTSPAILFYSVTVFKESWGLALTLLTFYLYFVALSKKKLIYYLLTGTALTLLFFEKYNYAVLVGLVFGLEGVVEILFNGTNLTNWSNWLKRQLALFLPLALFASWWILTPDNKLSQFLDIMRSDWNPVTVGVGNSWQYLTFFVQSIRVSYTFSDVLFVVIIICYLLAIKDLRQKKIRVLWLFFTLNFVLGTLHSINLQDRYIYTAVPALFLIVGYELNGFWSFLACLRKDPKEGHPSSSSVKLQSRLRGSPRKTFCFPFSSSASFTMTTSLREPKNRNLLSAFITVLFVLLVLLDFLKLPTLLKSNASHMLLSALYNETDYHDTLFNYNKSDWPHHIIDSSKQETTEEVVDYILDNVDINKPINYMGWTADISPDWVELRRQTRIRQIGQIRQIPQGNYLVTIEVKPTSREYTYDYRRANSWQLPNIKEITQTNSDKLVTEKDFKELGVIVRIYSL